MTLHRLTAEEIARQAHATHTDKMGRPYIQHVERVVAGLTEASQAARDVAWLHDVLEDNREWTAARLLGHGIPPEVVSAVVLLTRRLDGQTYAEYIDAIYKSGNRLAKVVKMSDLTDHLTGSVIPSLQTRYERAFKTLKG